MNVWQVILLLIGASALVVTMNEVDRGMTDGNLLSKFAAWILLITFGAALIIVDAIWLRITGRHR